MKGTAYSVAIAVMALALSLGYARAQSNEDLAKKLSNPIASLISVPFQFNYDHGYGPDDGDKATVNIQPVIPIEINEDWNVISRTILPVTWQNDIAGPSGIQFGLGDITQSFFFSPSKPTASGIVWGGQWTGLPGGADVPVSEVSQSPVRQAVDAPAAIKVKHASSIISFAAVAMIAAFGAEVEAIAAPEQIGCYGDNWGPTLEMLEPTPAGPLTFHTLRCMPIPEGWPRFLPPSLSPNGGLVFAVGYTKGLWLGDVTRGARAQIVNERLPGDLLSRTAPFAWLDDSTAIIGVKRDVTVPSGFSHGPLRPYLFNLDGSQEKLPALVHPNGPLDEIYWLICDYYVVFSDGFRLAVLHVQTRNFDADNRRSRVSNPPMAGAYMQLKSLQIFCRQI